MKKRVTTKIIDEGNGWIILQSDGKKTALWTRLLSIGKTDAIEYRLSLKAECEKDEFKPILTLKCRSKKKENLPSEVNVKLVGDTSRDLAVCHSAPVYSIIYKDYVSTSNFPIEEEDLEGFFQGNIKMVLYYQDVSCSITAERDESLLFVQLKEKVVPTKLTERQKEIIYLDKEREERSRKEKERQEEEKQKEERRRDAIINNWREAQIKKCSKLLVAHLLNTVNNNRNESDDIKIGKYECAETIKKEIQTIAEALDNANEEYSNFKKKIIRSEEFINSIIYNLKGRKIFSEYFDKYCMRKELTEQLANDLIDGKTTYRKIEPKLNVALYIRKAVLSTFLIWKELRVYDCRCSYEENDVLREKGIISESSTFNAANGQDYYILYVNDYETACDIIDGKTSIKEDNGRKISLKERKKRVRRIVLIAIIIFYVLIAVLNCQ